MKKKSTFLMLILLLILALSLSACNINGNSVANDSGNTDNSEITFTTTIDDTTSNDNDETVASNKNESVDCTLPTETITDWESIGIFAVNAPEYEFDFTAQDTEYSYEIGSSENEKLFSSILSGEKDYKNYFGWFAGDPSYIYRLNEECYKAAAEIIREGAFTQQLRDKYFGLAVTDTTGRPYLSALGIETESYQIYFNDDWSIAYIKKFFQYNIRCNAFERWHHNLIGYRIGKNFLTELDGEIVQYDQFIEPYYEEDHLIGYKITSSTLHIIADMGNGRTADCSVRAIYNSEIVTELVWNGQKQQHEQVSFLSRCIVTADFNNVYSGGFEMFDRILIFAKQNGSWDIFRVWEQYREEVLTPSLNRYETNEQKVYRLA